MSLFDKCPRVEKLLLDKIENDLFLITAFFGMLVTTQQGLEVTNDNSTRRV
jgi:hypothetical protein